MRNWIKWTAGLALAAGLAPNVWGQAGFPPAPTPPPPPPGAAGAAGGAQNIWSMLCMTPEQKQKCKDKLCKSQLGQLMNNGLKPIGALTGGILGPLCPPALFEDLLKPADSAEGAAARIKADEAAAKARRAAVRYLATVDCRYWPEARDALINSLRADRNECVRWEAAMAMGSGCCCNKEILRALAIVVSGSEADGNPPEVSLRVRSAAAASLDRCLACVGATPPPLLPPPPVKEKEEKPPETPPVERPPGETPPVLPSTAYYHRLDKVTMEQVIREGRLVLEHHRPQLINNGIETAAHRESNTLFNVVSQAIQPTTTWTPQQPVITPVVASAPRETVEPTVLPASASSKPTTSTPEAAPQPKRTSSPLPEPTPLPFPETPLPTPTVQKPTPPTPVTPSPKLELDAKPTPITPPPPVPQSMPSTPTPPPPPSAPEPLPTVLTLPPVVPQTTLPTVINLPAQSMDESPASSAPSTTITIPLPPPPPPAGPTTISIPENKSEAKGDDPVRNLMGELRDAQQPSRRAAAATALADGPGRESPEAVEALVTALRHDSDQEVRIACIRALTRTSVSTPSVKSVFKEMQTDRNPVVQRESWNALMQLVTRSTSSSDVR